MSIRVILSSIVCDAPFGKALSWQSGLELTFRMFKMMRYSALLPVL